MSNFTEQQQFEIATVCKEIISEMNNSPEAQFIISKPDAFIQLFMPGISDYFRQYYNSEMSREELLLLINEDFCKEIDFNHSLLSDYIAENPNFQP